MDLGFGEIAIILVIVLLLFGPTRLPQLGAALGRGLRNFKKATTDEDPPAPAEPQPATTALPTGEPQAPAATSGAAGTAEPQAVRPPARS